MLVVDSTIDDGYVVVAVEDGVPNEQNIIRDGMCM